MKHAYLIMAHNEFYILERLIKLLDNQNNDIYLHIDKKVANFDFNYFKNLVKKSNIYFIERTDIRWGDFSQINCELLLLSEASKKNYSYYHLLSGVDLPIKTNKEIYEFFNKNNGYEFIGISSNSMEERIKYYYCFTRYLKINEFLRKLCYGIVKLEKKFKVNRLKKGNFTVKKGANWFSISNDFVMYVLSKKEFIFEHFKNSVCADELLMATLIYNSPFKNKIYHKYNDEHKNIKRLIDWKRGEPYTFKISDFDEIKASDAFFLRKLSTSKEENKKLVDRIYEYVSELNK